MADFDGKYRPASRTPTPDPIAQMEICLPVLASWSPRPDKLESGDVLAEGGYLFRGRPRRA
jgi:hypothetical protein